MTNEISTMNKYISSHDPLRRWLLAFCLLALSCTNMQAQNLIEKVNKEEMDIWVNEQMSKMSQEDKLGQLVMPLYIKPNATESDLRAIRADIRENHFGGIVLSKGTMENHVRMVNYIQQVAQEEGLPPMLICIDGEWGLNMRLTDAIKYPKNLALGQINADVRDQMMYLYGRDVARQCKLLGIHVNLAPVLDVNSNPKNPVIGNRSFSADPEVVSLAAVSYAKGLEDGGVLAVGKHFPGHGDTKTDSHKTLPLQRKSIAELNKTELPPFQSYIDAGLGAIMTAHLDVQSLAEKKGMPATVSKRIVTNVLRNTMHFKGLIFTDGLAMKGATMYKDVCICALIAGNDVLLQPTPQKSQIESLRNALKKGYKGNGHKLTAKEFQQLVDEKCRRVLEWKFALGLNHPQQISGDDIVARVNTENALKLKDELVRLSGNPQLSDYDPTLQNQVNDENLAQVIEEEEETFDFPVPPITLPTATPQEVGMDAKALGEISRLATEAVDRGATPGCQVLVMRKGKIVYDQTFGRLGGTLEQNKYANRPVTAETMYDLASVSKATGTLAAVMMLMSENNVKLKDRITKWLPELKGTSYAKVTLQDLLYHESGLQAGYFFYKMTDEPTEEFRNTDMLKKIASLKPKRKQGQYLYSCLNFVLLRYIIERVSGERLDLYLQHKLPDFFGPWLCYNPLEQGVPLAGIAPTEQDDVVRHRFVHGTVHDETGAWALGVEGNSGLFGSAEALAPLLQMFLNDGNLNGKQYLPRDLCHQFTTQRSSRSRRGLGFDRQTTKNDNPNVAAMSSVDTWGHTGFTGTCFWVDSRNELVYIFLSNNICPTRENKLLRTDNYRSRIHEAIYKAIKKK